MFKNRPIIIFSISVFLVVSASIAFRAKAEENNPVAERFSQFDPESVIFVNHTPLSEFLSETIFPVGSSKQMMGTKARTDTHTGSRIVRTTSGVPSRYEGNRIMVHAFTPEHKDFLEAYQDGLELLSERRPLATLDKDEQLAYWLNLYNVIVLNKLVDEYPIKKLKDWRVSKKQKVFWDQKVTTVEGVPLSLRDIELILFQNWEAPLVMYGLFQGTIGGPSLPTEAFTGDNVWEILEKSANEFVNSNRGARAKGSRLEVSLMYEWAAPLFADSDDMVLAHIQQFAKPEFHGDLSEVRSVRYKTYNWVVADLMGGALHRGQHTQMGGVLTAGSGADQSASATQRIPGIGSIFSGSGVTGGGGPPSGADLNLQASMIGFNQIINKVLDRQVTSAHLSLPPVAMDLIGEMMIYNNMPRRVPLVTVTDCGLEGGCEEIPVFDNPPDDSGTENDPRDSGPAQMLLMLGSD